MTRVADSEGGKYIGGYRIAGQPAAGYQRFLVMWVDDPGICHRDLHVNTKERYLPDKSGRIAICGRVVFKGNNFPDASVPDREYLSYEFKEAYLIDIKEKRIRLELATETVDGVYYRFSGDYVEPPNMTGNIYLMGNMSRFLNGQAVSLMTLGFSRYGIVE